MTVALLSRVSPLLNKLVPTGLAFKGLKKIDPRIGKFLDQAALLYGADAAMGFLRNEFSLQDENDKNLRLDERAAIARKRRSDLPLNALGTAAKVGGALALGGAFGGESGQDVINPEVLPAEVSEAVNPRGQLPYNPTKALPSPEQAGYESQVPIPQGPINMGYNRTPEFEKREALKKYIKHKSEKSKSENPSQKPLIKDIEERFDRNYKENQQDEVDQALLEALNKILRM